MDERRTDFLYARPSFVEGVARLFDLRGTLNEYNGSPTTTFADGYAIGMDWYVVGRDIEEAISKYTATRELSDRVNEPPT